MSFEIAIVLIILAAAIVLFVTEILSVDLVALSAMGMLLLTGILDPEEGISGFSNEATITIAALYVLSEGWFKTGVVNYIGRTFIKIFQWNLWIANSLMMFISGAISNFINNTTQVAISIPILLKVSQEAKISASKLLMPLSYATLFGGMLTLIGTSTNILVNSIAKQHGQPPFSMFEFAHLGAVIFLAGLLYMMFIGIHLIPNRRKESDLTSSFGLGDYLTEIILKKESDSVGKEIMKAPLVKDLGVEIIEIMRDNKRMFLPSPSAVLQEEDQLRIKCDIEKIKELQEMSGILLKPQLKWKDEVLESKDFVLVEAVISPRSFLVGKNLKQIRFRKRFSANVLAIRHRGIMTYENIAGTSLLAGDALLIEINKANLAGLKRDNAFVVVSQVEPPTFKKSKIFLSLIIMAAVVIVASIEILPVSTAATIGAVLIVLTRCISLENAYRAIDWQVIMLLAGSISLGLALEKTGAAKFISNGVLSIVGPYGPTVVLSAFYLLTLILTETMSNNATAAVMTPIALSTAAVLNLDPRPFLIAVMFAASLAFMMPIGYQTHLMVFNPGRYRIVDFIKVGTPLNILFWIIATFLIPVFFPF